MDKLDIKIEDRHLVIGVVSEMTGVEQDEILGKSRKFKVSNARQMTMFILYYYAGFSHQGAANYVQRECHSNAVNAIRQVNKRRENEEYQLKLNNIVQLIANKELEAATRRIICNSCDSELAIGPDEDNDLICHCKTTKIVRQNGTIRITGSYRNA
jgi:hypothetical protein